MLPYQQSYTDPKLEKAYHRYLAGDTQRAITKALKIPARTLARRCKADGWVAEREARALAADSPNVAAAAAAAQTTEAAAVQPHESRQVGMERMLGRQQRIVSLLTEAYQRDVEKTIADAQAAGKPLSRSQIAQLTQLGNNLLTMERKAWCVPDKIETKDTTPQKTDPIREMTDEQLERRERELAEQLAAAEGRAKPNRRGKAAAPSVN